MSTSNSRFSRLLDHCSCGSKWGSYEYFFFGLSGSVSKETKPTGGLLGLLVSSCVYWLTFFVLDLDLLARLAPRPWFWALATLPSLPPPPVRAGRRAAVMAHTTHRGYFSASISAVNANVDCTARRFRPENPRKREVWRAVAALGEIAAVMAARPGARRQKVGKGRGGGAAVRDAARGIPRRNGRRGNGGGPRGEWRGRSPPGAAGRAGGSGRATAQPSTEKPATEQLAAGTGPCPGTTPGRPRRPAPSAA